MDQHLAEVVVVLITGIFSIITIIIQKKQDKVVDSINKKTVFMERERELRKKIDSLSRKREAIIHSMMILILDSNIELMKSIEQINHEEFHKQIYEQAIQLKDSFDKTNEELDDINKEYKLVTDMAKEAQADIEKMQQKK